MRAPLLVMIASLAPGPALAGPFTASLGLSTQVATARAYDLVDDDDHLPMLRVAGGLRLDAPRGALEADLGFSTGATSAPLHASREAGLWLRGLSLGATYRLALHRRFEPYAKLEAGWDWATLSLDDDALGQRVSRLAATGMLGFQVPVISTEREGVTRDRVVFDLGVGWTVRPGFEFDAIAPEPPERPDPEAIPRAPLGLGTLPMSGAVYRLGFTVKI